MKFSAKSARACLQHDKILVMVCPMDNDVGLDLVWVGLKKSAAKKLADDILELLSRKNAPT